MTAHEQLLKGVWSQDNPGGPRPARTNVKRLRRRLDDAGNHTYIFTKLRVGSLMPSGERQGEE